MVAKALITFTLLITDKIVNEGKAVHFIVDKGDGNAIA
jgi:hypothetical protein